MAHASWCRMNVPRGIKVPRSQRLNRSVNFSNTKTGDWRQCTCANNAVARALRKIAAREEQAS